MTRKLIGPRPMAGSIRISSGRASNGKYCLVQQLDGFIHLYTIAGKFVRVLDRGIRTDTQPMLDWSSDDYVFVTDGNSIYRRSLLSDTGAELIETFHAYLNLSEGRHGEGDLQQSGYMPLTGFSAAGAESVFTFNVKTSATGTPYPMRGSFDGVKVCDDGTLLVSGEIGIMAIPQVGTAYQVTEANGHACTCVDAGRSKLLWCSNARARGWGNRVELIDVWDPTDVRVLLDLGKKNYAMHLSAGNNFAVCSVYDPTNGLPNRIWRLPFDGSTPELLHEWGAPYTPNFEPRATCSGNLILFNVPDGKGACNVEGLYLNGDAPALEKERQITSKTAEQDTNASETVDPEDQYALIDYTPYEGRKFRLEQELVARGGVLVATSTRMYEQK